ncbi:DMT family transporter [Petroclostridium sp. X23]|uniref:DMT family transporter n=1 Tax=Petroclostridium sp. X23 TaxID=3045146 RepID=UPI0024AD6279|nr:DMT family transporter [Petroclostridium sp. X23]WHH60247.1 DMT family transporter [Petroclostridium sp. X23]
MMNKQIKADLILLMIAITWGSTFVLMKNALSDIPTLKFIALRFSVAFISLVLIFNKTLLKINIRSLVLSLILGILLCGGLTLQVAGLNYTTASKSAFITGLSVILVPVFSAIILKKIPKAASMLGVGLALTGLVMLTSDTTLSFNFGDFLTLLAALCFAFQIILIDKFTNMEDSIILGIFQVGFAALFSVLVLFVYKTSPVAYTGNVIIAILVTAIPATALALVAQTCVQKYTSPTRTALIFAAEPVFGAVFAYLIPNEMGIREILPIQGVLGCILILLGMLISELNIRKMIITFKKAVLEK